MVEGTAQYSRTFALDPRFDYLRPEDRYYLARPKPEFNLAVVGVGVIGREHIKNTFIEGRARIHGVYDSHRESVEAMQREYREYAQEELPRVYDSIDEAVADEELDGFIICTPNYTHKDVIEKVMQAGKPVLLEKPMASTVQGAAAIMRLAQEASAPVQVGLQYRYKAIYKEAIHEVQERGSVGSLKTLSIREHRIPFLDKVDQWNKFERYSGGTLVEKCCHYFDLFNFLAQSLPVRVMASGSLAVDYADFRYEGESADILDNASVIVEYANGVRATFDLCMFAPMFFEELVTCGDGGRLRAFEQEDFTFGDGLQTGLEVYRGENHPARQTQPQYPRVIRELGHSGATFFEHVKFIEVLRGEADDAPTVEEGFWSVVVGAAAEESVRSGQPVNINAFLESYGITVREGELVFQES